MPDAVFCEIGGVRQASEQARTWAGPVRWPPEAQHRSALARQRSADSPLLPYVSAASQDCGPEPPIHTPPIRPPSIAPPSPAPGPIPGPEQASPQPAGSRRAGPASAVPARRQGQGLARPVAERGPSRQSWKAVTCAPAPGRACHGCKARRPLGRRHRLPGNPRQAEPVTRCAVGRLPGVGGASALAGPIFPGPRGG